MQDTSFLSWPFFEPKHRELADKIGAWAEREIAPTQSVEPRGNELLDHCLSLVRKLGVDGWLRYVVPGAYGGANTDIDARSLCIIRETLAFHSGLADFVFALQGLGAGPISLFGSELLRQRCLPRIALGEAIPAFAISEADAGSDVSAMTTAARLDGNEYVIDGEKTWISNAGIADFFVVFCRLPEAGERAFVAVVVDAGSKGLSVSDCGETTAPHAIGTVTFQSCRTPSSMVVGVPGKGMSVALGTLDVFRPTVGAAALGLARRALHESVERAMGRKVFGSILADTQLTQARIASIATDVDASALLVYRAAWAHDNGTARITREAAMAKWFATEAAQRAVDAAVQLHGGSGVLIGSPVERLYREVRALRIYEGTSEIQQLVIAAQIFAAAGEPSEKAPA